MYGRGTPVLVMLCGYKRGVSLFVVILFCHLWLMVRVSNGYARHKKHRKYVKSAKGFRLGRKNVYTQVRRALVKQGQNAYIGRKNKKRVFRKLWIERLSAALRNKGTKYSVFMWKMRSQEVLIDRKVLSNIAVIFPEVFDKIVEDVRA